MDAINLTAIDLVRMTLLSMWIILANACWIPFLNRASQEVQLLLQFFLIAIPQSMIVIYPEYTNHQYVFFLILGLIGALFSYARYKMIQRRASDKFDGEQELSEHSHFLEAIFDIAPKDSRKSNSISCYQTCIMIMTVTAISAVDFRAFPPNFRKTHAFGLSLMDIGVALIISVSGLVMAKYLHGPTQLTMRKVVKMTWPLLAFGLCRGILGQLNIGADEYGRNWSFFLNLAFLPYTLLLWNLLPSPHFVPVGCFLIMAGYQYALSVHSYSEYIFDKNASNFFERNKVGIFSLIGYMCLFSMSCYQGRIFQARYRSYKYSLLTLFALTTGFWSFFFYTSPAFPPSRKLANFNYVVWSLANGSLHAFLITCLDYIVPERYRFIIFADMVSDYRLSIFIIANVLSQIVRLNGRVKSTSKMYLAGAISAYMFATLFVVSLSYLKYIGSFSSMFQLKWLFAKR